MFIVLNKCYGKFDLSDGFLRKYPEYQDRSEWNKTTFRANPTFIKRVRDYGLYQAGDRYSNLSIVSIPENVTDWRMKEYDGYETVEYVRDGLIFDA